MARTFVKANPDKIEFNGTAPVTGPPMTLSIWAYPDLAATTMIAIGVGGGASGSGMYRLGIANTNRILAQRQSDDGSATSTASGVTATAINQWQHLAARFTISGGTTVEPFYNGGADGFSNVIVGTTSSGRTSIGETPGNLGAGSRAWSGHLCDAAMWDAALTQAEMTMLSKGYSPLLVRPSSLKFYAPLIRDLQDVRGGITLTPTGTSVVAHTRILFPAGVI